jgi:hypothetical protein
VKRFAARSKDFALLVFWRLAAQLVELAVRLRPWLERGARLAPLAVAGGLAYAAGLVAGHVLRGMLY